MKRILSILITVILVLTMVPALAAENAENIVIKAYDSYGDGWSGGFLRFYAGSTYTKITLEDGEEGTFILPFNELNDYCFVWVPGQYVDEVSFTISLNGVETTYYGNELRPDPYFLSFASCSHVCINGVCENCGSTCGEDFEHSYSFQFCNYCDAPCPHNDFYEGICTACFIECEHTYVDSFCTACDSIDPSAESICVNSEERLIRALKLGGNITLTKDIDVYQEIQTQSRVHLDLNGHTLTLKDSDAWSGGILYFENDAYIKNGAVLIDGMNGSLDVSGNPLTLENVEVDYLYIGYDGTAKLEGETVVKVVDLIYGTLYRQDSTVEKLYACYTCYTDFDRGAVLQKDHSAIYDEDLGLWMIAPNSYKPTPSGETVTLYYNNWNEEEQFYYFGYEDADGNEDYTRSAETVYVEFSHISNGNGESLMLPMTTEDNGKTWKIELDKVYTNCWMHFFNGVTASTFMTITPTESDWIYDFNIDTWIPYDEFLGIAMDGDTDGDGELTTADATLLLQYLVGQDVEVQNADMNEDGQVTIFDAIRILQTVAQ